MNLILAEMGSVGGILWETAGISNRGVLAGLFFLVLMCGGVALDFALALYCVKRPSKPSTWIPELARRALSGRMVLVFFLVLIGLYLANSLAYSLLFTSTEIEPTTLLFQTLFLQLPALLLLFGGLRFLNRSGRDVFGFSLKTMPRMLGLSVLFYLAAIPLLWFYSLLYQVVLDQFGYHFYLQDVTQVFLVPQSSAMRACIIFIAVGVAPFFEEIVFRGILYPWAVQRAGFWPATVVVSLIFAGIHMHLPSLLPLFLLSCMFCVAYARTKSLWVSIGMHACFNGVTIALLLLAG